MNIDDIPSHYLARESLPPDNGMTPLEWVTYLVAAASAAGFGVLCLFL